MLKGYFFTFKRQDGASIVDRSSRRVLSSKLQDEASTIKRQDEASTIKRQDVASTMELADA
jgi:hypothetical protein